jgi:phosphopantetheinyl transferase
VDVWRVALDQPDEVVAAERGLLTQVELAHAERGIGVVYRRRTLSRAALRVVLSRYLDVSPNAVGFSYDGVGKPRVVAPRGDESLCFSLTHSGDCCLIAVATSDVGIDVEQIEAKPDLHALTERHFAAEEVAAIRGCGSAATRLFFCYWTSKEALIKALGGGLATMPLDGLVIRFNENGPYVAACRYADPRSLTLALLPMAEPWCAAVAVHRHPSECTLPLSVRFAEHGFSGGCTSEELGSSSGL